MATAQRLICASADLVEAGDGVRFVLERHGVAEAAFAIRWQGRVRAYFNRCAHVPVELDAQPGKFLDSSGLYLICTVHGALYDPTSGACLLGRCQGRGLEPLPVEERNGAVYLMS